MVKARQTVSNKAVGYMMYMVSVGMPLTNIPQLTQIYSTKVTTGLSVSTWIMYLAFGFIPLAYAINNRLKPLVISNILWMIVYVFMIYGIIRYSPGLTTSSFEHLSMINNIGKTLAGLGMFLLSISLSFFAIDLLEERRA